MRKKIVAGNWKMNTLPAEGVELAKGVVAGRGEVCSCVNFIVCPPFTHLAMVAEALKGSDVALGAQNCAAEAKGAYTGEVAASMIAALGCKYVILGHSERRQYYGETSATLNKKMEQAYANNLVPIYCVGENLEEREAGKHFDVVKAQIEEVVYNLTEEQFKNLVIAYEPVWAIGTGKTATADQAQEIHAYIRKVLADKFGAAAAECPILYGGSCKPPNAAEIFAQEGGDGGLFGGGPLKAADLLAAQGGSAAVSNVHTVKPIDADCVAEWARKCGRVVTVGEHSVIGGLGDAVAGVLMGKVDCAFRKIGVQDQFGQSGKAWEVLAEYGLTAPQIAESIKEMV